MKNKEDSKPYLALVVFVKKKSLLNDMAFPKSFCHTGNNEVFHSLYNKYCPKMLQFSYHA